MRDFFCDSGLHIGVIGFVGAITLNEALGMMVALLSIASLIPLVVIRWRRLLRGQTVESKPPFHGDRDGGFAPLVVVVVLAALGLTAYVAKPKIFHGETRRAEAAAVATKKVEDATDRQSAVAAASVVKIGEANAAAPASPAKDFIAREVPVALASLPAPDAQALLEAERRKSAVMEGRAVEAESLYVAALKRANALGQEKAEAIRQAERANVDLLNAAAAHRAAEQERNGFVLVAVACAALYVYVKITHVSPGALAEAVRDIKANVHPIQALDSVMTRTQQGVVKVINKLKA
jgi:hypothetical protein